MEMRPVKGTMVLGGERSVGILSCVEAKYNGPIVAMLEILFCEVLRIGGKKEGRHRGVVHPRL